MFYGQTIIRSDRGFNLAPARYGLKLVTPPAAEPITLTEAKLHCRIDADDTSQDTVINDLIAAARYRCERVADRALISQVWRLTMDAWPNDGVFLFPRAPLAWDTNANSITYIDYQGNTQTWDSSQYNVDSDDEPGRIALAYRCIFPVILPRVNAVTVTFTAGYGAAAANVPVEIRERLKVHVGYCWENREQRDERYLDSLFAGFWIGEYR